jgi:phage terminase small subunit
MPALKNPRHERVAQGRAQGKSQAKACRDAGYAPHTSNASRLIANDSIKQRVCEIQADEAKYFQLEKQSLINALLLNIERALGFVPVKVGADGVETYVYRGDVANAAIKLAGSEIGLFKDNVQVNHGYPDLSDIEVLEALAEKTEELLRLKRERAMKTIEHDPSGDGEV